jgi:hypothetical protein
MALRRTAITLVACVALTGCQDSPSRPPERAGAPAQASPQEPRFAGRLPLTVRPGLQVVAGGDCVGNQVCSADGQAWVPFGTPVRAVLTAARTRPDDRHLAWVTALRFDPAARPRLARAARDAVAAGGVVLLLDGTTVLAAVPPTQVRGSGATFTGQEKADAWRLVEEFAGD